MFYHMYARMYVPFVVVVVVVGVVSVQKNSGLARGPYWRGPVRVPGESTGWGQGRVRALGVFSFVPPDLVPVFPDNLAVAVVFRNSR